MPSDVEIANRAITKLGDARIISFDDNTTAARAIKSMYVIVRRSLIRQANWNFAMTRASIGSDADVPAWGFDYKYTLPDGFLRLVQVNDYAVPLGLIDFRDSDDSPYQFEGNSLITNYGAPLKIRYLQDITDPTKFDSCFAEAFASFLAHECCETITQNVGKKDRLLKEFMEWMKRARQCDAIENPPESLTDDSWLASRY